MRFLKKNLDKLLEAAFLLFVFFYSQLPLKDFDIWFHLKSGELFVKLGHLSFTDVFSYTQFGRPWVPYEWLFQVVVYLISLAGIWLLPLFISVFVVLFFFFFLRILTYIFEVNEYIALASGLMLFSSIMEYFTVRPYVLGYAFVSLTLFLILAFIYRDKKWLLATPVVTLIWTNIHSTSFLAWGFMLSFAFVLLVEFFFRKNKTSMQKAAYLGMLGLANFVVTILPPLGFLDYKLLWDFYQDRVFLGRFIAEWEPLYADQTQFLIYLAAAGVVLLLFLFVTWRKWLWIKHLWVAPFIIILLVGFTAARNVPLAAFALFIIFGYTISELAWLVKKHTFKYIIFTTLGLAVVFFAQQLYFKRVDFINQRYYYPVGAADFVATYLKGNMFNEYGYGGYILYRVYPRLQVFIDGRTDIYRTNVMRDYLLLSTNKNLSDDKYKTFLYNDFWNKYNISFAIINTQKNNVMRKVAGLLNTDPNWVLVYWGDNSQVFVRKDGKNNEVIGKFGVTAATPYLRDPYIKGKEDQALLEYRKMAAIYPSAHTSNAIGFLLLKKGQYDLAKQYFLQAVQEDPTFESPFMNLAELSANSGDYATAIGLYQQAKALAPDRGLIYIRLGQLMLKNGASANDVREIWQEGVKNTIDDDARKQLQDLLTTM